MCDPLIMKLTISYGKHKVLTKSTQKIMRERERESCMDTWMDRRMNEKFDGVENRKILVYNNFSTELY